MVLKVSSEEIKVFENDLIRNVEDYLVDLRIILITIIIEEKLF